MVLYGAGERRQPPHAGKSAHGLAGRRRRRHRAGQQFTWRIDPITNLYRSMLDVMGAPTEKIGVATAS